MEITRHGSNAELRLSAHGAFDVCTSTCISLGAVSERHFVTRGGKTDEFTAHKCHAKSQRTVHKHVVFLT